MMYLRQTLSVFAAGFLSAVAVADDPVQWTDDNGGNGHWYQYVDDELDWFDAICIARLRGGALATITSPEEQDWVVGVADSRKCWLGGYETENLDWNWITDENWTYENWRKSQPSSGPERYLELLANGEWADSAAGSEVNVGYIIEWAADCNDDGIVDYGQILDGTLEDLDGNGIPDACAFTVVDTISDFSSNQGDRGISYLSCSAYPDDLEPMSWVTSGCDPNSMARWTAACGSYAWISASIAHVNSSSSCSGSTFGDISVLKRYSASRGIPNAQVNVEVIHNNIDATDSDGVRIRLFQNGNLVATWEPYFITFETFELEIEVGDELDLVADPNGGCHADSFIAEFSITTNADCNNDGIVDYGQILDGTLVDTDQNGVPDWCDSCTGDVNGDGTVDAADLGALLALWGTNANSSPRADANRDGTVDAADLGLLLGYWGDCP